MRYWPFTWVSAIKGYEENKRKHRKWLKSDDYIQYLRCQPWFKDNGDDSFRLNYDFDEHAIVFDVGGYKGEFSSAMICKYNCTVYIFEPLPDFFTIITQKFLKNSKVHPFCFGLSNKTGNEVISLSDNSSSLFIENGERVEIQLKNIIEFIDEYNINTVDLIKINIEGAEYDLLESLLKNNGIRKFKNIQVQFHDFIIPNAKERMHKIQSELSKTHELTYQYEFVWENWKIK